MTPLEDDQRESDEALAAEYVAGLTSRAERITVRDRMRSDFRFAGRVDAWEARLYGIAAAVDEVKPASRNWTEIERRAFGLTPEKETRLQKALIFWRRVAASSIGVVAGVITVLHTEDKRLFEPEPYIAAIRHYETGEVLMGWLNTSNGELTVEPVDFPVEGNLQLWLLHDSRPPQSLGMLAPSGKTRRTVPDSLRPLPSSGLRIAISVEAEGGAKSGAPTGEFIAAGELRQI